MENDQKKRGGEAGVNRWEKVPGGCRTHDLDKRYLELYRRIAHPVERKRRFAVQGFEFFHCAWDLASLNDLYAAGMPLCILPQDLRCFRGTRRQFEMPNPPIGRVRSPI